MRFGMGQPMVLPRIVPGVESVELGPVMLRRETLLNLLTSNQY